MSSETSWQSKAHRCIAAMCRQSYLRENMMPNGRIRAKHVPYSVPAEAELLIECLDQNDEHRAKSIMMHDYEVFNALYKASN